MLIELLSTDFFLIAVAAAMALAVVCGPLGSLIIWRRMSYFGDTLAHSALLGIALGLLLDTNLQLTVLVSCVGFSFLLLLLQKKPSLPVDTLLGIIAHSTLALGMVVLAISDSRRVNLEAYLFGDLLTIASVDLIWIVAIAVVVAGLLWYFWDQLLAAIVHPELAQAEGISVARLEMLLTLILAITIAVAMKVVGVLLITSLLIVPAAAARQFASTPEHMAMGASFIGVISVVVGLLIAFAANLPAGPAIVVTATTAFLLLYLAPIKSA